MHLTLTRFATHKNATLGMLDGQGVNLWTLEDLWKENQRQISCIPTGEYKCKPHGWNGEKVKFPKVWEVMNVPSRDAILIHAGNTERDTLGCILVGHGISRGALVDSRKAIDLLRRKIGNNSFTLTIVAKAGTIA